jgi:hypothetical protein
VLGRPTHRRIDKAAREDHEIREISREPESHRALQETRRRRSASAAHGSGSARVHANQLPMISLSPDLEVNQFRQVRHERIFLSRQSRQIRLLSTRIKMARIKNCDILQLSSIPARQKSGRK